MKKLKAELIKSYKSLCPVSKVTIWLGLLISFAVMVAAIYLYILFSSDPSSWRMIQIADAHIESSLGCCFATFIAALIAQTEYQKYL